MTKRSVMKVSKSSAEAFGGGAKATGVANKHRRQAMAGLKFLGAPKILRVLAMMIFALPNLPWSPTDHLELFAGQRAVTSGEIEEGRVCAALDVEYGGTAMDFMTPEGFSHAMFQVLRLKPGASMTLAPVCSSWVWVARGSTHRSLGRPLGEESLPACRLGNVMVARCCLLVFLAAARGIWWVLEQPRGSLLQYHPAFQLLSSMLKVYRKHIKMGNFGSLTEKGTWLYSGHRDIDGIDDFQPRNLPSTGDKVNLVDVYYDKKGIRRVKGNGQLKRSQAYPKQFGRALARLRTRSMKATKLNAARFLKNAMAHAKDASDSKTSKAMSFWFKHADLEPVISFLTS